MSHDQIAAAAAAQPHAAAVAAAGAVDDACGGAAPVPTADAKSKRSSNFVITFNDLPPGTVREYFASFIARGQLRFVACQAERAPTTGHLHWHAYIQLPKATAKTWMAVKKMFAPYQPDVRPRLGTHEQALAYCTKDESRADGPYTMGEAVAGAGARTDLAGLAEDIVNRRCTASDVAVIAPKVYAIHNKGLHALENSLSPVERPGVAVLVIVGPTSVGKSWNTRRSFGADIFVPNDGNCGQWFDNYKRERVLLLDEFKGTVKLQTFLRLTEQYPYNADAKHASVWAAWTFVIVISNSPPQNWWQVTKRDAAGRDIGDRVNELDAVFARIGLGDKPRPFGATLNCFDFGINDMDSFRAAFVAKINEMRARVAGGVRGSDLIPEPANWPAAAVAPGPGVAPAPLPDAPAAVAMGDAPAAPADDSSSGSPDASPRAVPSLSDEDSQDCVMLDPPPLKRREEAAPKQLW